MPSHIVRLFLIFLLIFPSEASETILCSVISSNKLDFIGEISECQPFGVKCNLDGALVENESNITCYFHNQTMNCLFKWFVPSPSCDGTNCHGVRMICPSFKLKYNKLEDDTVYNFTTKLDELGKTQNLTPARKKNSELHQIWKEPHETILCSFDEKHYMFTGQLGKCQPSGIVCSSNVSFVANGSKCTCGDMKSEHKYNCEVMEFARISECYDEKCYSVKIYCPPFDQIASADSFFVFRSSSLAITLGSITGCLLMILIIVVIAIVYISREVKSGFYEPQKSERRQEKRESTNAESLKITLSTIT